MKVRSCPICDTPLRQRYEERTSEFLQRQTCGIECGYKLSGRTLAQKWAAKQPRVVPDPRAVLEEALAARGWLGHVAVAMSAALIWRRCGIVDALAFVGRLPRRGALHEG